MVDVTLAISIFSAIVSFFSLLSIHLRSTCCDNDFSFDILNNEEYKEEHTHH